MRAIIILALCVVHSISAQAKVSISHAYAHAMPPSISHTAAFMQIDNHSDQALLLVKASGVNIDKVELHQTQQENGVMRMRQVESINIAAKQSIRLAPNGLHLMLMGVNQALNEGQVLALSLFFSTGQRLDIALPVRAHGATGDAPKHIHDEHRH